MLAYDHDALKIVYENFGFGGAWEHANLTASKQAKILTTGVVDAITPAIILAIWADSCLILGL
jgi:hypothetical protein